MSNKFTTAAKILFGLFLLIIVILALYLLIKGYTKSFWTILGYGAVVAVFYGVILEISDNVYNIGENQRAILEKLHELSKEAPKSSSSQSTLLSSRARSMANVSSTWVCECGRVNSNAVRDCACGRKKPSASSSVSSTSKYEESTNLVFAEPKVLDDDEPKVLNHFESFDEFDSIGLVKITEESPAESPTEPSLVPVENELPTEPAIVPPVEEPAFAPSVENTISPTQPTAPPAPTEIELFHFCPVCGTRNANNWLFCRNCGKDLRKPSDFSF